MIKANPTIFKLYLSMMDSFSGFLSQKYTEVSLDNPNHYKTIIIQKVVRMFHTLEQLVKETQDEVSARCVLRGILDSVTTYCFIYQREDIYDMMFRNYLYEIDVENEKIELKVPNTNQEIEETIYLLEDKKKKLTIFS